VRLLCELYKVTPAGFYAWHKRGVCQRIRDDSKLLGQIREIFDGSKETYGSPRVHQVLRKRGIRVGEKRVWRLMHEAGMRTRGWQPRKSKAGTRRFFGELPNRQLDLVTSRPNQIWVGDITYIRVGSSWRYIAIVLDKHSRRVVGWRMGKRKDLALTLAAFNDAVLRRHPERGLIFHSDRGTEYAAYAYRDHLTRLGVVQSMKRPSVITDNAHAESFFRSLKAEVFRERRFDTDHQVRAALKGYIPHYNRTRLHSALGYVSPIDYERAAA
jgi:transposase InsO family protein